MRDSQQGLLVVGDTTIDLYPVNGTKYGLYRHSTHVPFEANSSAATSNCKNTYIAL